VPAHATDALLSNQPCEHFSLPCSHFYHAETGLAINASLYNPCHCPVPRFLQTQLGIIEGVRIVRVRDQVKCNAGSQLKGVWLDPARISLPHPGCFGWSARQKDREASLRGSELSPESVIVLKGRWGRRRRILCRPDGGTTRQEKWEENNAEWDSHEAPSDWSRRLLLVCC